jgi:large subunit ribosomal protein L3
MNTHPGLIGKKLGSTQIFLDDGTAVACTVIQAGSTVVGKRTQEKDGYDALIVGFGEKKAKNVSKSVAKAMEKAGTKIPAIIREIRGTAEHVAKFEIGQTLKIEDIFEEGQKVDVQSTSRGRGFQGVFRRHHFAGLNMTHGTHEWRRHGGSIGTNMTPGRVMPGKKMPGQMGNKTVSVLNQKIAKLLPEEQLILLEGNVPGARNGIVRIQGAVKKKNGGKKK